MTINKILPHAGSFVNEAVYNFAFALSQNEVEI